MQIHEEKNGDIMELAPRERLDSVTSPAFEERLLELITRGERYLLLDFSSLDYMNSAGLKALLIAAKQLEPAQGKIILCGVKTNIQTVFELTGFDKLFTITPGRDQARSAFS